MDVKDQIKALIVKAAEAKDSGDAMRLSQAALNAANAMIGLNNMPTKD